MSSLRSRARGKSRCFTPLERPTGRLRINPNHFVASQAIRSALVFNAGAGAAIDLNNRTTYDAFSGATWGTHGNQSLGDNECFLSTASHTIGTTWSCMFRWRSLGTSPSFRYFVYCSAFNQMSIRTQGDNVWSVANTGGNNSSIFDGNWHTVVVTNGAASTNLYFPDGNTLNASTSVVGVTDFLAVNGRDDSTGRYTNGEMSHFLMVDEEWTAAEAWSLVDNANGWIAPDYSTPIFTPPDVVVGGASIINQFQRANMGADLYNGTIL